MIDIFNSKGMSTKAIAIAAARVSDGNHPQIIYADLLGVKTQTDAIWASIVSGQNIEFKEEYSYEKITWQGAREFTYQRTAVRPVPHYWHTVTVMVPNHDVPFGTIVSSLPMVKEEQLYRLLRDHSVYPAVDSWQYTLFEAGMANALIQQAEVKGDIDWCYSVSLEGWDPVFEDLARDHALVIR